MAWGESPAEGSECGNIGMRWRIQSGAGKAASPLLDGEAPAGWGITPLLVRVQKMCFDLCPMSTAACRASASGSGDQALFDHLVGGGRAGLAAISRRSAFAVFGG